MEIRRATRGDAGAAAALILQVSPGLGEVFGSREVALRVARAAFLARRTLLGHRFGLVAQDGGRVVGLCVAIPGALWPGLRVGTGLLMLRAAPGRAVGLIRRGRVLDRLTPPVPADSVYVSSLAVVPGMRRRGVGTALLGTVEELARTRGLARVTLDVGLENAPTRRFYEQLGFVATSLRATTPAERRLVPTRGSVRVEKRLEPDPL